MLSDIQIDELVQPIIDIYNQMELDLIVEIAERFKNYNAVSGSLEWQIEKLNELGALNQSVIKTVAKYSGKSEAQIKEMIEQASMANIDAEALNKAYDNGIIKVDPVKLMQSPAIRATLEHSYKELNKTYRLIQTKAIEATRKAYIQTLNTAYIDVASGTYDYQTAIKKAVQAMAQKGIEGATYKRGDKYVRYSIEAVVRRDTLTAFHQTANRAAYQSCQEMGSDYVEISQHLGARVHPTNPIANHAGWQGKVFKIEGSTKEYPNLKSATGYPDDIQGLGGVNCRHRMFAFFPGISVPKSIHYDEAENETAYRLSQKQRKLERDIRALKKQKAAADAIADKEMSELLKYKLNQKYDEINCFCEANGLRRDYSRELVSEQLPDFSYKNHLQGNDKYDKIKVGSEKQLDITIDKFTPCLEDAKSGKILETTYSIVDSTELRNLKGWNFDWCSDTLKNCEIFKLQVKGNNDIQGLVALTKFERDKAIYVDLAESAPQNLGYNKKYNGVGGHLFAIAAQRSKDLGYGGFVFMDAKNKELVEHYRNSLGAILLGMPHPYRMFIDEDAAEKLLRIYNFGLEG